MSAIILRGDARDLPLPDESVDLIVTSPPYFGLRDYRDAGESLAGQIGSEDTPQQYVAALLDCTREWMRVLKPSGSLFVNLGDKYSQRVAARPSSHQDGLFPNRPELIKDWKRDRAAGLARMPYENVIDDAGNYVREKSLIGIPWRYALGCLDDLGLILRAEILWSKANGLPESVTDRVRRSHEQVFHFTRLPRYFAGVDEIREPHDTATRNGTRSSYAPGSASTILNGDHQRKSDAGLPLNPLGKLPGSVWTIPSQPLTVPPALGVDHFAAFPMELPRRIIAGWSPPGICTVCGEGRRPVTEVRREHGWIRQTDGTRGGARNVGEVAGQVVTNRALHTVIGYTCSCRWNECCCVRLGSRHPNCLECQFADHNGCQLIRTEPPTRPAVVLDPFGGTGTTALIAHVLGRTGISVDRSADYCRLARWRTTDPGERARAMQVPKPPPVPDGQGSLFDAGEAIA